MKKRMNLTDSMDWLETRVLARGTCPQANEQHFEVIKSGVRKLLDKLFDDFGEVVVKSSELKHNKYRCDDDMRVYYFRKGEDILGDLGYLVSFRVIIDDDNDDNSHVEIVHGMVPGSKIREFNKEFELRNERKISFN